MYTALMMLRPSVISTVTNNAAENALINYSPRRVNKIIIIGRGGLVPLRDPSAIFLTHFSFQSWGKKKKKMTLVSRRQNWIVVFRCFNHGQLGLIGWNASYRVLVVVVDLFFVLLGSRWILFCPQFRGGKKQ